MGREKIACDLPGMSADGLTVQRRIGLVPSVSPATLGYRRAYVQPYCQRIDAVKRSIGEA